MFYLHKISFLLLSLFCIGLYSCETKPKPYHEHSTNPDGLIVTTIGGVPGSKLPKHWRATENNWPLYNETFSFEMEDDSFEIRIKPYMYNGKKKIPFNDSQWKSFSTYISILKPYYSSQSFTEASRRKDYMVISKRVFNSPEGMVQPAKLELKFEEKKIILQSSVMYIPKLYHISLSISPYKLDKKYKKEILSKVADYVLFSGTDSDQLDLKMTVYIRNNIYRQSSLPIENHSFEDIAQGYNFHFKALANDTIHVSLEDHDSFSDDILCEWEGNYKELENNNLKLKYVENLEYNCEVR